MSAESALAAATRSPARTAPAAVLGECGAAGDPAVVRLAGLLDPGFLADAGWNPATWVLAPFLRTSSSIAQPRFCPVAAATEIEAPKRARAALASALLA